MMLPQRNRNSPKGSVLFQLLNWWEHNYKTIWCLLKAVKSVFSQHLERIVAKWGNGYSCEVEFFVLFGNTKKRPVLSAQRDTRKFCRPLFQYISDNSFLVLRIFYKVLLLT